jgi:hypothetical protein
VNGAERRVGFGHCLSLRRLRADRLQTLNEGLQVVGLAFDFNLDWEAVQLDSDLEFCAWRWLLRWLDCCYIRRRLFSLVAQNQMEGIRAMRKPASDAFVFITSAHRESGPEIQ